MYSALILDDEELARKNLQGLLSRSCPQVGPVRLAENVTTALQLLQEQPVDILFLDVNLGTETGFDLLQRHLGDQKAVIFVTAHEEFSLRAIKAEAADYLLKPVDVEELRTAVDKAIAKAGTRTEKSPLPAGQPDMRLVVHHGSGFEMLPIPQIIFAEAEGNYTTFYLEGYRKVISSKQLGSYETLLPEQAFFRSHKSYIINLKHLKGYSSRNGYTALLSESYEVPVSRRKLQGFLELSKKLGR